jgi:hypothetical protein
VTALKGEGAAGTVSDVIADGLERGGAVAGGAAFGRDDREGWRGFTGGDRRLRFDICN